MSMKSLIEIDHNAVGDIKANPEKFAALLCRVLGGGYRKEDDFEDLWRFGVRYAGMKHSSEPWTVENLERLP